MHLTICSLRIRWSKNHTSRRRENPGHARHPAPQQLRLNQLWKWYEIQATALAPYFVGKAVVRKDMKRSRAASSGLWGGLRILRPTSLMSKRENRYN